MATLTFSGLGQMYILYDIVVTVRSKMATIKRNHDVFLSSYTCHEMLLQALLYHIVEVQPLNNTVVLVWILFDIGMTNKSKMVAINRKYLCEAYCVFFSYTSL